MFDWKTRIPGLTGDVDQDIRRVLDYSFQLAEETRYTLNNLDIGNFNEVEWATMRDGVLSLAAETIEIQARELTAEFEAADLRLKTTIEASISGLRTEVEEEIDGLGQWITEIEVTAQGIQSTVTGHTSTLNSHGNTLISHGNSISGLNNTTINLQSQITQTSNKISAVVSAVDDSSGNVTAASIVAAINAAGSSVKISADHVNISGVVTVQDLKGDGTVEINAGNIVAGGTISGVALESVGSSSWKTVTINNGVIDFYSGWIRDQDLGVLQVYGNSQLNLESDGYVYIFVGGRGKCWRIGSDGIYFCDNSYMEPTHYVPTQTA